MPRGRPPFKKRWTYYKTIYAKYLKAKAEFAPVNKEYLELKKKIKDNSPQEQIDRLTTLGGLVNKLDGTLYIKWKTLADDVRHIRKGINSKIVKQLQHEVMVSQTEQ